MDRVVLIWVGVDYSGIGPLDLKIVLVVVVLAVAEVAVAAAVEAEMRMMRAEAVAFAEEPVDYSHSFAAAGLIVPVVVPVIAAVVAAHPSFLAWNQTPINFHSVDFRHAPPPNFLLHRDHRHLHCCDPSLHHTTHPAQRSQTWPRRLPRPFRVAMLLDEEVGWDMI